MLRSAPKKKKKKSDVTNFFPVTWQALHAFKVMHEHRIRALPVLGKSGQVVGNISAKDLKVIGDDATAWDLVQLPVSAYLKAVKEHSIIDKARHVFSSTFEVVSFQSDDTFIDIIHRVVHHRVHQIYYVDKHHQLLGVLTLKDILNALLYGTVKNISMLRIKIHFLQQRKYMTEHEKHELETLKEHLAVLLVSSGQLKI